MSDQTPDSSSPQESAGISYDDYMIFVNKMKNKNMNPQEIQIHTYYNVLHAFRAESHAISNSRILIIQDLKKVLDVYKETHFAIEEKLDDDPLVKRRRNASKASDKKEEQRVTGNEEREITAVQGHPLSPRLAVTEEDLPNFLESQNASPATIQDENAKKSSSSSTCEDSLVPSWGQVSPKSLVGRLVNIRMPGEDDYAAFHIKGYNEETEMHHLVTNLSKTYTDPSDWIDIRHIPAEDIVWQDERPEFPAHKSSLKPGETILGTTSTSQDKNRITEVRKSASGIPIISKLNKGKGIARE